MATLSANNPANCQDKSILLHYTYKGATKFIVSLRPLPGNREIMHIKDQNNYNNYEIYTTLLLIRRIETSS